MDFASAYADLNPAQRQAVDTIDGPLLVIAGPGTGKTQLLSARVANILQVTDTLPQNILCLTFTENGAANMRERLTSFIGKAAYDVTIGTYHAFGGDIISRFGHFLVDEDLREPIDTLAKHQIVSAIVESLGYRDALKQTRHHIKDLIATISEIKRALLTPDDLRRIATDNEHCMQQINTQLATIMAHFDKMPRKIEAALPFFEQTLEALRGAAPSEHVPGLPTPLAQLAADQLELAIGEAISLGKTTPLTAWKNKWLEKNAGNAFILAGEIENRRLASLANVMEAYQSALASEGLYDFDDMILRAIAALEQNDDLRFTLQEQYLYIMLDEYQDTNAAQARLVQLLTDNPVNEGRPNIMAVGDDDQAIYAFQGAEHSNMVDFARHYTDTAIINLSRNYRSHAAVLKTAQTIAGQIKERVFSSFTGMTKELVASNSAITTAHIERRDFQSDIAEHDWVARTIDSLIREGTPASEIAILTPKHTVLEAVVPHLLAKSIPVHYEKRENILETPVIRQLLAMSRLAVALSRADPSADTLWPQVLSFPFWQLPVEVIWQLSWQVNDHNRTETEKTDWMRCMLNHDDGRVANIAGFFAALSLRAQQESCETLLDILIGTTPIEVAGEEYYSPLRDFYTGNSDQTLYDTLSYLTVLRSALRSFQRTADHTATLEDLLSLVAAYEQAGERLLNTSPYAQAAEAVQLMTVFKAKGLEFKHVFLLSSSDDIWGGSGTSSSNKLTLPPNLAHTRYSGATEDERLRLLFVAITRAKQGLYLTSHTTRYNGKATKRLKYLDEREDEDGSFSAYSLPEPYRRVQNDDSVPPELTVLQTSWHSTHLEARIPLRELLAERLSHYQLSPTHLNTFCDLIYGGPQHFFFANLLHFPSAPSIDGQFGNTIHETLQWIQHEVTRSGELPTIAAVLARFGQYLAAKKLPVDETERLHERGEHALTTWLASRGHIFTPTDKAETNFRREGVFVEDAHLAGKIDRMEIDHKAKTITVVDYKTGSPHSKWSADAKLHKYRQQLYCYKLLIEGSHSWKGYTVQTGRLEFIEPDDYGHTHTLELTFTEPELEHTRGLLVAMWRRVQALDFPDTADFAPSLAGIKQFETYLLTN